MFILLHLRHMRNFILLLCVCPVFAYAQNDTAGVRLAIETMFNGMRKGDSALVRSAFHHKATLHSTLKRKTGETDFVTDPLSDFIKAVGTPHTEIWNEVIWNYEIKIDGIMATAWTPYTFYLGDKLSHCGVNAFTLMNTDKGWKIVSITDTRRKENCKQK